MEDVTEYDVPHVTGASGTFRVTAVGMVGFPGKGIALAVVGGLLVYAAITFDPSKARGLDGA